MPRYLYIQLQKVERPVKIRADKMEQAGAQTQAKLGDNVVGEFQREQIQGWWIDDEPDVPDMLGFS